MKTLRFFDRQTGSGLMAFALLVATAVPGLVPAFASAAQVSARSIELSSSAAGATNVTYKVTFTVSSAGAGAYVLDFCNDSPIPGQTCTAPTDFSTAGVATSTGSTTVANDGGSRVIVTQTVAGSGTAEVVLTGITNPSSATSTGLNDGFYARIITYASFANADTYVDGGEDLGTSPVDNGGVAMAITNEIGVSAAVRETLTFCVASAAIDENCAGADDNLPVIELGEDSGGAKALVSTAVSTGSVFTQLSTNAASGAVVNLKSNATGCGGLKRFGAPSACNIGPATAGISDGDALFGLKTTTATATTGADDPIGVLQPVTGSGYNDSTYFMGYVAGEATGVTSTYGDPILDSNSLPVNNQNMELIFGASASNNTPAGSYSANLSMIATGTY